ncbi:MAG: glycosyltransferase family 2 protein [Vicinamibacterales bacterium]
MTPSLSIVIPCFNEAASLPRCVAAVDAYAASKPQGSVEVVIVDDGSTDGTWEVLSGLVAGRVGWRAVRLAANRGSHVAMRCAYRHATGERVVNLPVDLQDPIENIDLLGQAMTEQGVDAVLAVRRTRADGWFERVTSRLYHGLMHAVHLRNVPVEGTSQFLLKRRIVRQINACDDRGFTFEGFLASAPLSLAVVWYDRSAATDRPSRWTLAGKIQHALNTVLGFSNVPIRALSLVGATVALVGLAYAAFVVIRFAVLGDGVSGWPSLMTVLLVVGGLNLLALGLIGEYVWRILDETRRRPLYQVEDHHGFALSGDEGAAAGHGSRSIE